MIFNITGDDDVSEVQMILAQYNEQGVLISVKLLTVTGQDEITEALNADTKTVKGFVWDMRQKPLSSVSCKEIK